MAGITGRQPAALSIPSGIWRDFLRQYWLLPVVLLLVGGALLLPRFGIVVSGPAKGAVLVLLLVMLVSVKQVGDHVAALVFFLVAVGTFALPPAVAFAGFAAGASWLILAGMILGAALTESGLTGRIAERVLGLIRPSYASVIGAIALLSLVLVFLVPSTAARVLLLVPIVIALADRLGYRRDGKGFAGMVIAIAVLSYLPCTGVMTSNVRNLGVIGAVQSLYGIHFTYSDFLVWNLPFLSLALTAAFALLIVLRYRETPRTVAGAAARKPLDRREKGVLAIAGGALALWMTDFAHGLSPAWVGLAAAVLCLYGPSRDLPFGERVKFGGWVVFVAFISLAAVLGHTGFGEWLGHVLVEAAGLEKGALVWNLGAVTLIGIVVGLATTNLAGPVVLASLAQPIADATGWSVPATIIAMMPSWSVFPFAYQAPVILVAMRMAEVPVRELNVCLLWITAVALVVIIPLQFAWLWALGLIH